VIGDFSVGTVSRALPCGCAVGLADDTNGHMGSLPNPWVVKLCDRHANLDVLLADATQDVAGQVRAGVAEGYAAGRAQALDGVNIAQMVAALKLVLALDGGSVAGPDDVHLAPKTREQIERALAGAS
jgi:hypothetical protein